MCIKTFSIECIEERKKHVTKTSSLNECGQFSFILTRKGKADIKAIKCCYYSPPSLITSLLMLIPARKFF